MSITTASQHGIARGRQPFRVPFPGVTPTSSCWATVCELNPTNLTPMYGGAFLTIEQVVPGNGEVTGRLFIDNVPNNIQNRVTVYHDDFMADTPVFTIVSPVLRGRGRRRVTLRNDAFKEHPNVWASVTEIDDTGARPIFGTAFLTIEQIVPDPDNGVLDVGVWIDAVPNDINYQVNVTGL